MLCLPMIVVAFIGLMFTASLELNSAFRACFSVLGGLAFLGELCCILNGRGLTCPKCHKRVGYLLLDSKNGGLLLPGGLPPDIHQCPYCHVEWEQAES